MFDYLQQFNSLPQDLRVKVSSPEAMAKLSAIEKKYGVDLAMIVMKVMIKTLSLKDMTAFFVSELNLPLEQAQKLTQDLKIEIFSAVADYVGLETETKTLDLYNDIDAFIKEAGLVISSEFLIERLKKILATYLKGVRSRIDTRGALAKTVDTGGLNLSDLEIDRVLKICDAKHVKYEEANNKTANSLQTSSRLEAIIAGSDKSGPTSNNKSLANANASTQEYDLKKALASGETKKIGPPVFTDSKPANSQADTAVASLAESEIKSDSADIKLVKSEVNKSNEVNSDSTVINTKEKLGASTDASTDLPAKTISPEASIVRKPDSTSLFKKLFTESQKQSPAGSIKFAARADQEEKEPMTASAKSMTPATPLTTQEKVDNNDLSQQPLTSEKTSTINRPSTIKSDRTKMQDVRVVPKIMGPIEELQFLDLINFRRLGKTPEEITSKIFNKVKMLERDGYEKMITGITAWKKSPVSLLYLKIVQEAIVAGITLQQAISARQNQNQDYLGIEEINAIIKLNSRLVF